MLLCCARNLSSWRGRCQRWPWDKPAGCPGMNQAVWIWGSLPSVWVGVNRYRSVSAKETVTWRVLKGNGAARFAGKAAPVWETVSHSITFNPEKDDGKYWHFPSIKTMAFAQVIKAPTHTASLCGGFQCFSGLKNKNVSEWWGFGSVCGECWLFHFALLCHLGMLTC